MKFLYSKQIGIFLAAVKKINKQNGSVCFLNANPLIVKTLKTMGIHELANLFDSEEEALLFWNENIQNMPLILK